MRKQEFVVGPGASSPDIAVSAIMDAVLARKKIRVTVQQFRRDRSDPQNRALFGVAYKELSEFTGFSRGELHQLMLKSYFGTTCIGQFGQTIELPLRTTTTDEYGHDSKLNTLEFQDFYEHVAQKAAEIGCVIPPLDPSLRAK